MKFNKNNRIYSFNDSNENNTREYLVDEKDPSPKNCRILCSNFIWTKKEII